ncbi:MAG: phage holin family protein [Cyclobacteriaceae bacterium]
MKLLLQLYAKYKLAFIYGYMATPILFFVEKYLFNDWEYLAFLVVAISLDTLLGLWDAWRKKKINIKRLCTLRNKLLAYMILLVFTHVLTSFTVNGKEQSLFGDWFRTWMYASLMVMEGISIINHLSKTHPNIVPLWLRKRFIEFNETGELRRPFSSHSNTVHHRDTEDQSTTNKTD